MGDRAWQTDRDRHYGAATTDAGRAAIGVEPAIAEAPATLATEAIPSPEVPRPTKPAPAFEERRYASLSHIACDTTGAHRSGPRFFGLARPMLPSRSETAHG